MVLPGFFDPHTHIGNERSFEEEAETETRAAVLGGVTTIGIFIRRLEGSYLDQMPALRRAMDERSYVDSVFHPQIFTRATARRAAAPRRRARCPSYKFYMSGIPGIVASVSDDFLLEGFRRVAALGPDAVACVHCETGALVEKARNDLRRSTPEGTLADWEKAHPAMAEALAIQTAAYPASCAGAHLYVVHLSSRDGLEAVRDAGPRAFGSPSRRPPYLGISSEDPNGFLAKMVPPVRPPKHHDALWEGLRNRRDQHRRDRQYVALRATKKPEAGLHGSRPGCRSWARICRLCSITAANAAFRSSAGRPRDPRSGQGLRHLSAQGHHRGGIGRGFGGRRSRARARRARAKTSRGCPISLPFEGKRLRGWPVPRSRQARSWRATERSSASRRGDISRGNQGVLTLMVRTPTRPSFRVPSQRVRPLAGPMTGSAREPGIHNDGRGLPIRARPLRAIPE